MTKVFFGGSRRLGRLSPLVKVRAEKMITEGLRILVGDASGADKSIQSFFAQRLYTNVDVYFSGATCRNNIGGWPTRRVSVNRAKRDFRYFVAKDVAMSDEADYGLMIWDGQSQGTVNNILNLLERRKIVVIYVSPSREFLTFRFPWDAAELLRRIDESAIDALDKKIEFRRRIAASQQSLSLA